MGNKHSKSSRETSGRLRTLYLIEVFTRDHSDHAIPDDLKHLIVAFYTDKNSQQLLKEYDVLGEDADLYRKSDSTKCMIKELSLTHRSRQSRQLIDDQFRMISRIKKHPAILELLDVYHDHSEQQLFLIFESAKTSLVDVIINQGRIPEAITKSMVKQALSALVHIHDRDIVHGQIQPNCLMTGSLTVNSESTLKLMFFPDRQNVHGHQVYDLDGTGVLKLNASSPYCVAPEVLTHRSVRRASDMWSIGCVLYIMLVGFPPFWTQPLFDDGHRKLKSRIVDGRFSMPPAYWDAVSDDAKDLVMNLLKCDPGQRLTAKQAMNHKWLCETG